MKQNLAETKQQITQANLISNIVHCMQIERGLSTGFVANNKNRNSALTSARKDLDKAIKDNNYLQNSKGLNLINSINKTRESIDKYELSAFEVRTYYTQQIITLLDFIKMLPTIMEYKEDRNYIQAYSYLSSAKEQLGQIRAILYEVFVTKTLSQENFIQIKESLNIYNAAINRFKKTLNKHIEFLDFYNNSLKNKVVEDTFNVISFTLENNSNKEFNINPIHWFDIATNSINIFKNIEQRLFSNLNDSINKKIDAANKRISFILFALLLLFGFLIYFMHTTINKILSSAHMFNEEFENSLLLLEQYKATVDESFIVSKTDAKGVIRYANDAFCKISGYTKEELIGKAHNIIRHPDMPKEAFYDMWHTIKDLKKPWVGDVKNCSKNGTTYWMKVFINPIIDKNGDVLEYIAIRTDITDLQEEKERIRNTLGITTADFAEARHLAKEYEHAIDETWSVIRTDTNNIITHINETFAKLSGYVKEELVGKNCIELRQKKHSDKKDCENIQNKLASKEIVHIQFENLTKDKKPYYLDTTIVPILDDKGNVIEYFHLMSDITELMLMHLEIEKTQQEIIYRMGEISESRSKETGNHINRVANYSRLLAIKAGFDEKEANMIAKASPMHDIGKVAIPDAILLKPGPLNEKEWEIMQSHCDIGYKVLSGSQRPLLNAAAIIAKEHHEKYDGNGYPNNKAGEDIHVYARIVAIADVFDALGSDRVYKKAWEFKKILDFIKEQKGKHFDPILVELFLENVDDFLEIRDKYRDVLE
ncbi:MAG: hypothetical protein A2513_03165 [Sulfurimonas sp. RIFOXYD12_FULL_33_39]|uniref:PAS domain S-box protein n=1 Tax=unclassified Sulfurimonas TaxID=2623549 RepID=UPI0008AE7BCC|nr:MULTISPECIES: PAS domain S-box protein [unclassified Sulfurimonas]OHE08991.1 MAG: hypothetical protein A2513_03165 [Sulfurimonas sp. RIFOXYD12_FULL_33_39]OHE14301.1 MAG: hypothetical protein A2530_06465 [Sulfurimonas sp. RIFOXYD2_FULL_34_21]